MKIYLAWGLKPTRHVSPSPWGKKSPSWALMLYFKLALYPVKQQPFLLPHASRKPSHLRYCSEHTAGCTPLDSGPGLHKAHVPGWNVWEHCQDMALEDSSCRHIIFLRPIPLSHNLFLFLLTLTSQLSLQQAPFQLHQSYSKHQKIWKDHLLPLRILCTRPDV